jgi:hypothetical protein
MADAALLAKSPLRGFGSITDVTAETGPLNPDECRVHPEGGPQPFAYWLSNSPDGTPCAEVEVRFSAAMRREVYNQRLSAMVSATKPAPVTSGGQIGRPRSPPSRGGIVTRLKKCFQHFTRA